MQKLSELEPIFTGKVWDMVSIDILELPVFSNSRYLLVIQDLFSKWLEACPIRDQKTETIIDELVKIFCKFGFPRIIHSDQGRNFESYLMKELCRIW